MSCFSLPLVTQKEKIIELINPTYTEQTNVIPVINKTLSIYLNSVKTDIDNKQPEWDKFKKYTNPYEYIHTVLPNSQQSICRLKPLSRSFYKMIEISNLMKLEEEFPDISKTFHLAEGPGGFIEAICNLRQSPEDTYYGMTLINDSDISIPGWKKSKSFLNKNKNVIIETGHDKTGNLMIADNLKDCYLKYNGQMDLVTADGGFDFSIDFNQQETLSAKLIFCQIAFAIAVQKKGGNLVIKMFDTFTQISIDLLYLLSCLYNNVFFVKPHTSRYANSEKYIVCKYFKLDSSEFLIKHFYKIFQKFSEEKIMVRLFSNNIPNIYITAIEEINAVLGQQQIESICTTLNLIDNNKYDRLENMKKNNTQKCINWCQKHHLPYNKIVSSTNIFLNRK